MILFGISDNPLARFQYLLVATLHAQFQNFALITEETCPDKAGCASHIAQVT